MITIQDLNLAAAGDAAARKKLDTAATERAKRTGATIGQARQAIETELAAGSNAVTLHDVSRAAVDVTAAKKVHAEIARRRAENPALTVEDLRRELRKTALNAPLPVNMRADRAGQTRPTTSVETRVPADAVARAKKIIDAAASLTFAADARTEEYHATYKALIGIHSNELAPFLAKDTRTAFCNTRYGLIRAIANAHQAGFDDASVAAIASAGAGLKTWIDRFVATGHGGGPEAA